jgi:hypothetical protein
MATWPTRAEEASSFEEHQISWLDIRKSNRFTKFCNTTSCANQTKPEVSKDV